MNLTRNLSYIEGGIKINYDECTTSSSIELMLINLSLVIDVRVVYTGVLAPL